MNYLSFYQFTSILFFLCMNLSIILGLSQFHAFIGNNIELIFILIAFLFLLLNYSLNSKIQLRGILFVLFVVTIGSLSFFYSGGTTVFKLAMFFLIARGLSERNILFYNNSTLLFLIAIIFFSSIVGITDMSYYSEGKRAFRFGFQNPNTVPVFVFALITGYNLIHENRLKKKIVFFELLITGGTWYFCQSRTALIVLLGYLLVLLVDKNLNIFRRLRFLVKLSGLLFLFGMLISYYIASNFNITDITWLEINRLFSGRFLSWQNYLMTYGIHLFGSDIDTSLYGALDNGYLQLLLHYGISVVLVYIFMFSYIFYYAYLQKRYVLLLTIIAYEVYFFNEFGPMSINFCTVLLVLSNVLINKSNK